MKMHTTETRRGEGTTFHHNGDYSGEVVIEAKMYGRPGRQDHIETVEVPFEDLRELVYGYLRMKRTAALEGATDDEFEKTLL
jgi:hypothetical protein